MTLKYYLHFQGNKNDVDFETLLKVGEAFSQLLNASARQMLLSGDSTRQQYDELRKHQLVTLNMHQTEKGSCVIPIVVDLINAIDAESFKSAVDYVLSSMSNIFNEDVLKGALSSALGGGVVVAVQSIASNVGKQKEKYKQREASSLANATAYQSADQGAKDLLANDEVRQASINLLRSMNPNSLNTEYSIENDIHETLLRTSRERQGVFREPRCRFI